MRLLELPETASVDEIKRAYHLQAYRFHPDRNSGDKQAQRRFISITKAYRCLMRSIQAVERGKKVGQCTVCGHFGEVVIGLDGRPRCTRCIFQPDGGRLLPMPALVVARCVSTVVLIGVSIYLLVVAMFTEEQNETMVFAAGAVSAGWLSLGTLAYTCLRVLHCLTRRESSLQRSYQSAESEAKASFWKRVFADQSP